MMGFAGYAYNILSPEERKKPAIAFLLAAAVTAGVCYGSNQWAENNRPSAAVTTEQAPPERTAELAQNPPQFIIHS